MALFTLVAMAMLLSLPGCGQDDMPVAADNEASSGQDLPSSNDRQSQVVAPSDSSVTVETATLEPKDDGNMGTITPRPDRPPPVRHPKATPPVPQAVSPAPSPTPVVTDAPAPIPTKPPALPSRHGVAVLAPPPPPNYGYEPTCYRIGSSTPDGAMVDFRQCRESRFIEWSRDGEQILFGFPTAAFGGDPPIAHVVRADGSALRPLLTTAPFYTIRSYTLHFSLSPDGSTVVHNYGKGLG